MAERAATLAGDIKQNAEKGNMQMDQMMQAVREINEASQSGSRIANDTATSLVEIVAGISESSKIVGDIAQSSEEQNSAITEINSGVDQVAQVVQQNSATAEQSAAASQQMSGQADSVEELIAQFKLRDTAPRLRSGPRQRGIAERSSYIPGGLSAAGMGKY